MIAMSPAPAWQSVPDTRAAYALAGHAVIAAHFGIRFDMLALARPFGLDLGRQIDRGHLLAILFAGHAAEAALVGVSHPLVAPRSPRFLALREALAAQTGTIDGHGTRRARLTALTLVRQPGNWAAVAALAARLATGEMIGALTARQLIRSLASRE